MSDYDEIIKEAYEEMEQKLIASMKRNFKLHLSEEAETGRDYPQWQAIKLNELRRYQKENRDIVKRTVGSFPDDVAAHLESELKQGGKKEVEKYKKLLGKKFDEAKSVEKSFFKLNRRKLAALQNSISNDLAKANAAVLRMMDDQYRQTIFKYTLMLSNGALTQEQAYDAAVRDFLSRGINCIEYKNGRRVNIADYADMAVKTASKRAQLMGEGAFRKSIGNPLIIITAHNTTCPLCAPFQNKVLIDDVYSGGTKADGDYMLLSEAMKQGLFHPRCRHGSGTYYPELQGVDYKDAAKQGGIPGAEPAKSGKKLQKQSDKTDYGAAANARHADSMVKKYKRLVSGSLDAENIKEYEAKLKYWRQKRREYIDEVIKEKPKKRVRIRNKRLNKEQFERYHRVLDDIAPETLEKFIEIKYNDDTSAWNELKRQYRIVNQYKTDSGYVPASEILRLDERIFTEKRTKFSSKFKKSGNIAGAYINDQKEDLYIAHSALSTAEDKKYYKGNHNLVVKKSCPKYKYIDVIKGNGELRGSTDEDTEAKLFEFFADHCEDKDIKTITMLSERGMCDSCKGVIEQFKQEYPNIEVNVISNKRVEGDVWKNRKKV